MNPHNLKKILANSTPELWPLKYMFSGDVRFLSGRKFIKIGIL